MRTCAGIVSLFVAAAAAHAEPVDWVNWASFTPGNTNGVAVGTMTTANGPVTATYTGNLSSLYFRGTPNSWGSTAMSVRNH